MTAKDPNSITMKAFNLAYSALTWLLDKIMRLLPSGGALMDLAGVDKVLQDTFGSVFDKYKVLAILCSFRASDEGPAQLSLSVHPWVMHQGALLFYMLQSS